MQIVNTIGLYVSNFLQYQGFDLFLSSKYHHAPDFCNKSLFTNAMRLDYVSSDHVRNLWEKQKI